MRKAGRIGGRGLTLLLLTTALATVPGLAAAQTAAPAPAEATPPAAPAAEEPIPGDIVVTAQKRAENIQDVPIAITAFGGQALRERGINRIDQIAAAVPNVQVQDFRGLGQPTFVIRGVALLDFNPNNTPAAAIYSDDVYQSSTVMGSGSMYDIERVEVLKGPQAGLYGRNTTGGAIQIISAKPKIGATNGYFDATYSSFDTLHLEGGQSIPLGDQFAARISASVDKGWGGWQTSLPSGKTWGAPDRQSIRAQLLWEPSAQFSANLKVFYARDESELTLATATAAYDATGAKCAQVLSGYMDQAGCLTWNQLTRPDSPSAAIQSNDGRTTLSQPVNQLHNRDIGATLNLAWDFGGSTLTSITGFDRFKFGLTDDFAAAVDNELIQEQRSTITYVSQELRLASNPGPSRLSWTVGANFAYDHYTDWRHNDISGNTIILDTFGLTPETGRLDLSYRQNTTYFGIFAQGDYKITDRLTFSAAGRVSWEDKQYRDGDETFPLVNYYIYHNLSADYSLKDHFTGKVSLSYRPTDQAMVYASISKGYKSGGFYGGFPTSTANVEPYKEEVVYSYEAGAKTEWFDRKLTLNGAFFFYDHKDAQGFSTVLNPLVPDQYVYNLTNIGTVHHYGIELEATLRPVRGLTLQANGARLWAKVVDSDRTFTGLDGTTIDYLGRPVDFAPDWSGSFLARYETNVASGYRIGAQGDYNFRTDLNHAPTLTNQALYALPGYGIAGGRIFATDPKGWTLALYATNLFEKNYRVATLGDGLGSFQIVHGQPRRVGVELTKSW